MNATENQIQQYTLKNGLLSFLWLLMILFSHISYGMSDGLLDEPVCVEQVSSDENQLNAGKVLIDFADDFTRVQQKKMDHDTSGLKAWLDGPIPRGDQHIKNMIPVGNKMKFCSAAGCPTKIPFTFTSEEIQSVAEEMNSSRKKNMCTQDTTACERLALQYAVRKMDQIILKRKLQGMSLDEINKNSVKRIASDSETTDWINNNSSGQQLLRDCVDQAANGSSYIIILSNNNLVKHHRVISPGVIHLGPQPHYFTRIEDDEKSVYRFDLYRTPRTDFEKLPGIVKQN